MNNLDNEQQQIAAARKRLVHEFMLSCSAMLAPSYDIPSETQFLLLKESLNHLASQTWLFPEQYFPFCEEPLTQYELYRTGDHEPALYLNVLRPKSEETRPHNHATWAVIAAVSGEELNRLFIKDASKGDLRFDREVVIRPGDPLCLRPEDIHSIRGVGGGEICHLHLYGRPLTSITGREGFDLKTGEVDRDFPLIVKPIVRI